VGLAGDDAPNGRASVPLVNDERTVMTLSADDEIEALRAQIQVLAERVGSMRSEEDARTPEAFHLVPHPVRRAAAEEYAGGLRRVFEDLH